MNFVSFDLAKKLKEKGFSEKCLAYYDVDDNVGLLYNTQYTDDISPCQYMDLMLSRNSGEGGGECDNSECCIDAPTISQVLNWLRKEKEMYIIAPASFDEGYWWELRDFNREISEYGDVEYTSYEQATLAGIEYVLDNLI